MKKTRKKGFTLVEMMLVIAIIVILAAGFVVGISAYLNQANGAKNTVSSHNDKFSAAQSKVNALG